MANDVLSQVYERFRNEGNQLFKDDKFQEAAQSYSAAIDAKKDEPVAYSNRAMCYIKLNRYYEALKDCDEAIGLNEKFVKAYYRRALVKKELALYKQAIEDYKKVSQLDLTFQLAKREVDLLNSWIKEDRRVELSMTPEVLDKPIDMRSKVPLQSFELFGKPSGTKLYRQQ